MTQGPDTWPWWDIDTLCRWMFFVQKNITRIIQLCTLILLIKVVQWSSESSYLLVKITKLCVKWFLFIYKNKMRHPPFPLPRTRYFCHHCKTASYPTRRYCSHKAAHRLQRAKFTSIKIQTVNPDLNFFWHPALHQSDPFISFSHIYLIPPSFHTKPFRTSSSPKTPPNKP